MASGPLAGGGKSSREQRRKPEPDRGRSAARAFSGRDSKVQNRQRFRRTRHREHPSRVPRPHRRLGEADPQNHPGVLRLLPSIADSPRARQRLPNTARRRPACQRRDRRGSAGRRAASPLRPTSRVGSVRLGFRSASGCQATMPRFSGGAGRRLRGDRLNPSVPESRGRFSAETPPITAPQRSPTRSRSEFAGTDRRTIRPIRLSVGTRVPD